ncbi:hypothetical protein GCM10010228_14830 [Streptomyces massasporeus]|nr:hypothetical protein GCM10010228_14830 [Streptomyces massasporeus]
MRGAGVPAGRSPALGDGRGSGLHHALMENIGIRPARPAELAAVASLRWAWLVENGSEDLGEPDDFVRHFVAWAEENARTHHCTVVVRDDRVIGMAWLAVVQRVPTPRAPRRPPAICSACTSYPRRVTADSAGGSSGPSWTWPASSAWSG